MANIKDFAVGLVVTAPSPALSGNTATLRPGEAAEMPVPPFYAVAAPQGQLITRGTSEKILVTAVDTLTDIITFSRAQGPTSAKAIAQNWIIANTIFADDITGSGVLLNQPVIGTPNGALKIFTTATPFSSIVVYRNGIRLTPGPGADYTVTNSTTINFNTAPATGAVITIDQIMGSSLMINGSNSWMPYEVPSQTRDGVLKVFSTGRPYIPGTLEVFHNGLRLANGVHYFETNPALGTYTMDDAPIATDNLFHTYQFVLSVSGNSDTVDGFHANNTPTAGNLLPLDTGAKIPFAAFSNLAAIASLATSTTNPGDAGGTYRYIDLGGLKVLFGRTNVQTAPANSEFSKRITFPAGFFTAQPTFVSSIDQASGSVTLNYIIGNAINTAFADIYWRNSTGSAGIGGIVSYIAIGL